eukprot:TRINITY_DN11408_c0_g1_i4.p1 TRINITY_DN11408_c0_g1~~TRINITY_DN11408_c0_g1_i4.p1  ORF type:complete len:143 (-),score=3.79 TRINITY_DN11408_c0_g1_i4:72-500(-)
MSMLSFSEREQGEGGGEFMDGDLPYISCLELGVSIPLSSIESDTSTDFASGMEKGEENKKTILTNINVISALPRVSVRYAFGGNMSPCLYYGEIRTCTVRVENIGDLPIAALQFSVKEQYSIHSEERQDEYYMDEVYQHLIA